MSTKYKAITTGESFFITITAIAWVDVLLRLEQKELIVKSLDHCQKAKGLEIYAYVIMSSHIHILCKAAGEQPLSEVIRDFKTFTSKMILKNVIDRSESRREWMLELFQKACAHLKRN
ncbi:transposase [Flavobacterium sp. N1718]|uniref:transposase n=1 Tax=unclassified Flavobacterium TaxID=196869 RepID=UPI0029CAB5F6|nr:transposase [Flavobacterium sp. N1718]